MIFRPLFDRMKPDEKKIWRKGEKGEMSAAAKADAALERVLPAKLLTI
jgi:hypothetical protein